MTAPENVWSNHTFHAAVAHSARERFIGRGITSPSEGDLAQARISILEHWLANCAPAGVA